MQTEVPTLPVVHLNAHTNLNRKQNSNLRNSTVQTKTNTPHKNIACLSSNKKSLRPLLGQPYQSSVQQKPLLEHSKLNRNSIKQRVLSAKMLHIKELQNQLADAHYQLNELGNENRLLKSLQKRQDSALKRYEGTNAELPRIINSHHEELRVLQIKYKKLKVLHKETCTLLKEKENELQQLQSQSKHLLQLSKDRNLGEREKLQLQVSDLNYRMQQQQDTIQVLHRKLALESKSLKQQLYAEISKRKETQKRLNETIEKLKSLENLLDNRERRLYYNGQLLHPNKNRHFGTQSLTNLRDISSSNPLKLSNQGRRWQKDAQESSLPILHTPELNDKSIRTDERTNLNQTSDSVKTETMANLEQIRKYRLQKLSHRKVSSNDFEEKPKEVGFKLDEDSKFIERSNSSEILERQNENDENQYEISADSFRKIYENRKYHNFHELLKNKVLYSSEGGDSEDETFQNDDANATNNSRKLCTRLLSNTDDTSDSKELTFSNCTYRDKLKVLQHERKDSYESDSEVETEIRKESIKHYMPGNHQNDAVKLISSMCDDQIRYNSNEEVEELTTSRFLNESQKIYQNLIREPQAPTKSVTDENLCTLQYDVDHTHKEQIDASHSIDNINKSSEDLHKYMFEQSVDNVQEDNDTSIKENELQDKLFLQTFTTREYDQLDASFISSNKIELTDIDPESLLHTHEIFNGLQNKPSTKNSLSTSSDLDKGQITSVMHNNEAETSHSTIIGNYNVETKNKLNKQEVNTELKSVDVLLNNVQSFETDSTHDIVSNDDVNTTNEISVGSRTINYDKEKLLATMRAIDDNENIEFLNQDYEKHNATSRKQITENLYRGLPTHTKKKQDIIKDIFDADGFKNEPATSCNKLH